MEGNKILHSMTPKRNILARVKMDIQNQYQDIQLREKHLTYSVLISKYSSVISKIFI